MEIDEGLVARVAELARLGLRPDEARRLKEDVRRILAFVRTLEKLDPAGIPPSIFPLDATNVLREDEPRPSLSPEEALANSPVSRDGHFVVPRILRSPAECAPPPPAGPGGAGAA